MSGPWGDSGGYGKDCDGDGGAFFQIGWCTVEFARELLKV
jgi:hypothetical protein